MHPADFAIAMVESVPTIVLDTETTGLDPRTDRVCGWVIAGLTHSIYVPVRHAGGGNLPHPEEFEHALARAFAKRARLGLRTVFHNAPFDLWFAAKQGVLVDGPLEDTMLNAVLIYDDHVERGAHGESPYSLAECAHRHKVQAKRGLELYDLLRNRFKLRVKGSKTMAAFHKLAGDDPWAVDYAVGDGTTTLQLWQAQQPVLDRDGLRTVHQLECDLIPYVARLRRRGMPVDLNYATEAQEKLAAAIRAARADLPAGFRPTANADVKEWMVGNGIDWNPRTKQGNDSFRADFLEESEAGQKVNRLRVLTKAKTNFVDKLFLEAVGDRIYPELVQYTNGDYGTHGGRFSCKAPNIQQFPKRNEEIGKLVRPIFTADEGNDFGDADVSQQEPRFYAHYGKDESLILGYNSVPPTDVHDIASRIMHIDRENAKTLGLSIFNGMQEASLARRMKIPQWDARAMKDQFLDIFPGIRLFMDDAVRVARRRGFVRTILGRRCYFRDYSYTRMAVSRVIQGSAADQMKLLLRRAMHYEEAYPERVNILMSIHDSLMFQSPRGTDLGEFNRVLDDNSVLNLDVPMPVKLKLGAHWGIASYGAKAYA